MAYAVRSSSVRNARSPVFASSTTRTVGTPCWTASKARATSSSWPVIVCPAGIVTVTSIGVVLPPLWTARTIFSVASVPGWPGSEKSTVSRSLVRPAAAAPAMRMNSQNTMTHLRCRRTNSAHLPIGLLLSRAGR